MSNKGGDQCKILTPNANLPQRISKWGSAFDHIKDPQEWKPAIWKAGLQLGVNITNNPCDKTRKVKTNGWYAYFITFHWNWRWSESVKVSVHLKNVANDLYIKVFLSGIMVYNMTDSNQLIIRHRWQNCQAVKVQKQTYFTDQMIQECWKTRSTLKVYFRVW